MLIFRILGGLCNLIMVNLLFIATSLPIITIGASLTGLCRVTLKMVRREEPSVVKDYFDAFKKHFKESTLTWLLVLLTGAFLITDLYVIFTKIDAQYKLLQIPVWIFLFIVASIFIYSFPMISAYPDKVKRTWTNAILISISHVPVTIYAIVIPLLIAKLAVKSGEWLVGVFSILLFFGFALLAYINCFFINQIFLKLTGAGSDEDNNDEEPDKGSQNSSKNENNKSSKNSDNKSKNNGDNKNSGNSNKSNENNSGNKISNSKNNSNNKNKNGKKKKK